MREKNKILVELLVVVCALGLLSVLIRYSSLGFAGLWPVIFTSLPLLVAIVLNLPPTELGVAFRKPLADLKFFGLACLIFLPPFTAGYCIYYTLLGSQSFVPRVPVGLGSVAAAHLLYYALPEELLFRGYMQKRLGHVFSRVFSFLKFELPLAGIICAAIFALAHVLSEPGFHRLLVFFPALVFAWLRHKTGSILAATLFHAACNILAYSLNSMFANSV